MTTVSLVECLTPVSMRTCGSSVSSLVFNRQRLQCFSPVKRVSALRTQSPEIRWGSASPSLNLQGALVSSPLPSPTPRHAYSQYSRCQSKLTNVQCYDSFSSNSSLSSSSSEVDLSSYGLDERQDSNFDDLRVVGSRPKLHGLFDVPSLKSIKRKNPIINTISTPLPRESPDVDLDLDLDRASSTSPENPPPSPINFRPSMEGFVVGGRKIECPEKASCGLTSCYSNRDFVPGFVKQPLYHCNKCEEKVVGQEQSEVAMKRRISCILSRRASHHRPHSNATDRIEDRTSCGHVSGQTYVNYTSPSRLGENKSFIEIYEEKRREKVMRDREYIEQRERRIARVNEEEAKRRERLSKREENIAYKSKILRNRMSLREMERRDKSVKTEPSIGRCAQEYADDNRYSSEQPDEFSDVTLPSFSAGSRATESKSNFRYTGIRDLASIDWPTFESHATEKTTAPPAKTENDDTFGKWQMRRCWSDIWPFPEDYDVTTKGESDGEDTNASRAIGRFRSKCRIQPCYPLPQSSMVQPSVPSVSKESMTSKKSGHVITLSEVNVCLPAHASSHEGPEVNVSQEECTDDNDITMTATVIIPEKDKPGGEWVTFSSDNEPILNSSPEKEDGTDTFLKRLQRAKLYNNKGGSLPSGQQFCFEAMVDKRYNRWKRRRRKKKESEARRANRPPSSDSSDDDRNSAVESILSRMYEQIHGTLPQTPNGTKDTPRIRRRRLKDRDIPEHVTNVDNSYSYYDASSEWTSDKEGGLNSSSSGVVQCINNGEQNVPVRQSNSSVSASYADDLCSWPFMEEYKQEMMRRIQATPPDKLEELDQKDWLPDITQTPRSKVSDTSETDVIIRRYGDDATESLTEKSLSSDFYETITPIQVDPTSPRPRHSTNPSTLTYSYSKWSRSQKVQSNSFTKTDRPVRTNGSTSRGPAAPQCIGVVTVGGEDRDTEFSAALKPIRGALIPSRPKQPKKTIQKEASVIKKQTLNFPSLSRGPKSQTPTYTNKAGRTSKKTESKSVEPVSTGSRLKPKSQPSRQPGGTKSYSNKSLLFRDYYLRSLYSTNTRVNSHLTGTRLKKAITVDNLEFDGKKPAKKADDGRVSNLSFSRAFTFSMFELPQIYRLYNGALERRARGDREHVEG